MFDINSKVVEMFPRTFIGNNSKIEGGQNNVFTEIETREREGVNFFYIYCIFNCLFLYKS